MGFLFVEGWVDFLMKLFSFFIITFSSFLFSQNLVFFNDEVTITFKENELIKINGQKYRYLGVEQNDTHIKALKLPNSKIGNIKKKENVIIDIDDIFADPIIEDSATNDLHLENKDIFQDRPDMVVTVGFKPGVTDNPGKAALDGFKIIFPEAGDEARISTYVTYAFSGIPNEIEVGWLSKQLHNNLIERAIFSVKGEEIPKIEYVPILPSDYAKPAVIDLEVSDEELLRISDEGLLALNLEEMKNFAQS